MRTSDDLKKAETALKRYCDMMAEGKGAPEALEATGLSHAQADLAWYGDTRNKNHVVPGSVTLPTVPEKDAQGYEVAMRRCGLVVAQLRAGEHTAYQDRKLSWGQIAVVCGTNESAVRRYFKATGLDSKGTRKGRGGRWLSDEPRFYVGNHKGVGVEDANPKRLDPKQVMAEADTYKSKLPDATKALQKQIAGSVRKAVAKRQPAKASK